MQTLILSHYPPVIQKIREIQQIAAAEDAEFSKLNAAISKVTNNMFAYTADETGIERFEKVFGIVPEIGQDVEDRRIRILSRMAPGKISLKTLTKLIAGYTGGAELALNMETLEATINADTGADIGLAGKILDEMLPLNIYYKFCIACTVDESGKEQMRFSRLKIYAKAAFFGHHIYDGTWRYDGTIFYNDKRRYWLKAGIRHKAEITNTSAIRSRYLSVRMAGRIYEMSVASIIFGCAISAYSSIGAGLTLRAAIREMETTGSIIVETRTRERWFYNGAISFNGAKKYNSIYKKETEA